MDLVARVRRLPRPGETVSASDLQAHPGGKGANQAVAAARLGARTRMIGCVGTDGHGEALRRELAAAGVDIAELHAVSDRPTGTALIAVDEKGQNQIVVVAGANGRMTPEHLPASFPAQDDVVVLQLEIPMDTVVRTARMARAAGRLVILNTAPAAGPLPEELLAAANVLCLNETEASMVVPAAGADAAPAQRAEWLARDTGAVVVVTLGEQGALHCLPGASPTAIPAFRVKAVDATAAGDAFVGALAVALGEAGPPISAGSLARAVRFANAAGALAAARAGAIPSIPFRPEVDAMLEFGDTP